MSEEDVLIVRRIANDMPTYEAFEVVRCKDCKNYKLFSLFVGGKGIGVCTRPFRLYACWIDVDEDDFCSFGERREQWSNISKAE